MHLSICDISFTKFADSEIAFDRTIFEKAYPILNVEIQQLITTQLTGQLDSQQRDKLDLFLTSRANEILTSFNVPGLKPDSYVFDSAEGAYSIYIQSADFGGGFCLVELIHPTAH